jgi:hypothetical protein
MKTNTNTTDMKQIRISVEYAAISRGNEKRLVLRGETDNHSGFVRGISGKKVEQLLLTRDIIVDRSKSGLYIDIMYLDELELKGKIQILKRGDKFKYTAEELKDINSRLDEPMTARKTLDDKPEKVRPNVNYVVSEDSFRVIDVTDVSLIIPFEMKQILGKVGEKLSKSTSVSAEDILDNATI